MPKPIYDFIAVGIGPFNLGLAALSQAIPKLNALFVDANARFDWHPGMMLPDAQLQTPFMADLVTLADPTSRYSFLNYLKQQGRIYRFYIRENFFLLRKEYNQYCQWVSQQLDNLQFNTQVDAIRYDAQLSCYEVQATLREDGATRPRLYYAKKLVLGTGPKPYLPACCHNLTGQVLHSSDYLPQKRQLQHCDAITLIGSGQSAAEIFYDLLQDSDNYGYQLNWLTRSPRFFPLEYSKLTLEMTSPDYVDYFYQLATNSKQRLLSQQQGLYKGINTELINAIFDLLYRKNLDGKAAVTLLTNAELVAAHNRQPDLIQLTFNQLQQQQGFSLSTQALVLATGFHYPIPGYLQPIRQRLNFDAEGRFDVSRHYGIGKYQDVFVQNAELHSHGFVAADLGMACYRNAIIINQLAGAEIYPLETRIAFQQFAAPADSNTPAKPAFKPQRVLA